MGWKFKTLFSSLLLLILLFLPTPDPGRLLELQAHPLLERALEEAVKGYTPEGDQPATLHLSVRNLRITPPTFEPQVRALYGRIKDWAEKQAEKRLVVRLTDQDPDLLLAASFDCQRYYFDWTISIDTGFGLDQRSLEDREYFDTWISLVPPILAILLAVILSRTIVGLFVGALVGAWIASTPGFFHGLGVLQDSAGFGEALANLEVLAWELVGAVPAALHTLGVEIFLEHCLMDSFRLPILLFVVFLCATVGVMTRMGAIQGLVDLMRRKATTMRSTQLATFLMGLAIFFDDYANTIVVGNTMRPLTDRFRLAREKLAYIVDSSSAPVAGLAYFSTWIAYEVSTFSSQLPDVGLRAEDGYAIFGETIPYRFYCLFTLALVFLTIVTRREFGPMARACERALATGELVRKGGRPLANRSGSHLEAGPPCGAINAVVPLVLLIAITVIGIKALAIESVEAILWGSVAAFLTASGLALGRRLLSPLQVLRAAWASSQSLSFALAILMLAWAIGYVCESLGTAPYLVAAFSRVLSAELLPITLFFAACLVSFSTGSSWSTMAILLPNVVVLAHTVGTGSPLGSYGLMILSIGAVLEGSIFGDHCSPISDTTILSSVSASSDHMDHTRTQLPYALLSMGTAVLVGYLPVAWLGREWVWLCLPLGVVVMLGFLLLFGRDPARAVKPSIR